MIQKSAKIGAFFHVFFAHAKHSDYNEGRYIRRCVS